MSQAIACRIGELTIQIDRETCIGSENCIAVAPEVFEIDADGICAFKAKVGKIDSERLIEACQVCPVDALIVIDAQGEQIVP